MNYGEVASFKIIDGPDTQRPALGGEHPEMAIHEAMQNRIKQEVFGTFVNKASAADLTLKKLQDTVDEINEYRAVYYCISKHAPIRNENGERMVYFLEDPLVVLVHPENLSDFKQRIDEAGLIAKDLMELTVKERVLRIRYIRERKAHGKE